jgi:O-glycosyl hydrolase
VGGDDSLIGEEPSSSSGTGSADGTMPADVGAAAGDPTSSAVTGTGDPRNAGGSGGAAAEPTSNSDGTSTDADSSSGGAGGVNTGGASTDDAASDDVAADDTSSDDASTDDTAADDATAATADAGVAVTALSCPPQQDPAAVEFVLDVDLNTTHQSIDGFGASDAWSINPLVVKWIEEGLESDVEGLADLLFDTETGIGLSAWRFNVGAGSAEQGAGSNIGDPYRRAELLFSSESDVDADSEKQAGQVRMLLEAYERGVRDFVAFSNSPPTYLTKNGLAHPGNGTIQTPNPDCPSAAQGASVGSTNLCPEKVDAFAEFIVKVLEYLRDDIGVPVNYVSPVNEPTWEWQDQTQEGNRYNVEDIKAVYGSLQEALLGAGLGESVEIDGTEVVEYTAGLSDSYKRAFDGSAYSGGMNGSGNGSYKNYIDEFLGDAAMRDILGNQISMHGYFSDAWADRMGTLRDLTWENVQETSPGAKVWMSEVCILGDAGDVRSFTGSGWNGNDMGYALHVAKMLHRDMTRLNASAWHWWLAVTPYDYKDGLLKVNGSLDASSLQTSKVLWTLGHFSRFIRPDFVRVELPGFDDLDGLMASAYTDASHVVIVVINASESAHTIELDVPGAEGACFEAFTTDADHDLEASGVVAEGDSYAVPPRAVVTFRAAM